MDKALFPEFPPVSPEAWRARIETDLKGKPFEKLYWKTLEGVSLPPFLCSSDIDPATAGGDSLPGEFPFRRGNVFNQMDPGWQIVQEVSVDDIGLAKSRLQEAFANKVGACKLYSWMGDAPPHAFLEVLEDIDLRHRAVHLYISQDLAITMKGLLGLIENHGWKTEVLTGTLTSLETDLGRMKVESLLALKERAPHFRPLGIDLSPVDENGGTLVQQLAIALSRTVDWLSLDDLDPVKVASALAFTFPVGSEFMLEIAKFRAFRMLFARVLEVMGIEDPVLQSPFIIAQGARWNKTRYDVHNNLLRTTTETISAVIGGAHAVVVPSFDKLLQPENAFSARMARNIQHILRHESYLDRVADPGGGAYYLEYATDLLAHEAWKLFQEIEAEGGYQSALRSSRLDELLEASAHSKQEAVASRKRVFVGVNQYPNPGESLPGPPWPEPGDEGAAPFEQLRIRTDAWAQAHGQRPEGLLLTFGDLRMRNARAQFSRNLIGCGGFSLIDNPFPSDWEAALQEAKSRNPAFVVLCAADEDYTSEAVQQVRKTLPGTPIVLAGKAPEGTEPDLSIFLGVNALEVLQQLQDRVLE